MTKWKGAYTYDKPPSATGAPSRLKVATCQIAVEHDIDRNTRQILDLIQRAAEAGADVAHFPECAVTGYGPASWPNWEGFAWSAVDAAIEAIRDEARAKGIWVVTGSVHRASAQARPTNSLLVLDRHGAIVGQYDKRRCSINDLRAFAPGERQLIVDIEGVRCGFLICLDWSFPELWIEYAGQVELIFHSCVSDNWQRDKNEAHTIPALMQGYAWLNSYAISVSNSCRPSQAFASFWIERSGTQVGALLPTNPVSYSTRSPMIQNRTGFSQSFEASANLPPTAVCMRHTVQMGMHRFNRERNLAPSGSNLTFESVRNSHSAGCEPMGCEQASRLRSVPPPRPPGRDRGGS